MNNSKNNLLIQRLVAASLLVGGVAVGQVVATSPDEEQVEVAVAESDGTRADKDSLLNMPYYGPTDEEGVERDSLGRRVFHLQSIIRGYDDHITVRWSAPEYAPWISNRDHGYRVVRVHIDDEGFHSDTIAQQLVPLTQQEFMERFPATDSIAGAAMQMLYVQGTALEDTEAVPGSMASVMEVYDQQQMRFGLAMMIAEQRPDLAVAMGLAVHDYDVKPNVDYQYAIEPLLPENDNMSIQGLFSPSARLGEWKPEKFETQLSDTIIPPATVYLMWPRDRYSSYYVERRCLSEGSDTTKWVLLNETPFVPMISMIGADDGRRIYPEFGVAQGEYEYRVSARDEFGDALAPCEPYRLTVPDLVPPMPPLIHYFELLRGDTVTMAKIYLSKDTLEEDFVGYIPYYHNDSLFGGLHMPLLDTPSAPTDTVLTVNVTGLPTGDITVGAIDRSNNMAQSMPQSLHVADLDAPSRPKNLRSIVSPLGEVVLVWSPCPERDVMFYKVYWANDTSHVFMARPDFAARDTVYRDTLALNVSQLYVYYSISATDFSGNESEMSDTIRVERPNLTPPTLCHLDRIWDDGSDDHINVSWWASADPDVDFFRVFRRKEMERGAEVPDSAWTMIAWLPADSIIDGKIRVTDYVERDPLHRYVYAVETFNRTGISSGLSNQHGIMHRGSRLIPVELKLEGAYRQDDRAAVLTWKMGDLKNEYLELEPYICIYRRMEDEIFRFLTSVNIRTTTYDDYSLPKGKEADYQIRIRLNDGRFSPLSNDVHVVNTIPANPEED